MREEKRNGDDDEVNDSLRGGSEKKVRESDEEVEEKRMRIGARRCKSSRGR